MEKLATYLEGWSLEHFVIYVHENEKMAQNHLQVLCLLPVNF